MNPELQLLKSVFDKAELEYELWHDRAYRQVKEWRMASQTMKWLGYLIEEKNGLSRGQWLPPGRKSGVAHGLDHEGRIVVMKESLKLNRDVSAETFFYYEADRVTRLYFLPEFNGQNWPVRAVAAGVLTIANGLPASEIGVFRHGASVAKFEIESERVVREHLEEFRIPDWEQPVKEHEYRFAYDHFGKVDRIWQKTRDLKTGKTNSSLDYERSDKQRVGQLLDQFASRLPDAIDDAIANGQVAHPCYALLLQIIAPDGLFPPAPVAAADEYLELISKLPANRRRDVAWDPGCDGFVATQVEFRDSHFLQICENLTAAVASLPVRVWQKQALQTIKAACRRANELGAANGLPHTRPIVIAAVDMHGEIIPYKLVADCIPADTKKQLKEQRLL